MFVLNSGHPTIIARPKALINYYITNHHYFHNQTIPAQITIQLAYIETNIPPNIDFGFNLHYRYFDY